MDPRVFAHRTHDSQVKIREAARSIAAKLGEHPTLPAIPAVPRNSRGHQRDVAHLKQNEAIGELLTFAALVLANLDPDEVTYVAHRIGEERLAESAAQAEEASAEREAQEQAEAAEVYPAEVPEYYREYVVVEGFEQDGITFDTGTKIMVDPYKFGDWIELGMIIPIEDAADPNPETPEPVIAEPAITPDPAADPNPETPEPAITENGAITVQELIPLDRTQEGPGEFETDPGSAVPSGVEVTLGGIVIGKTVETQPEPAKPKKKK